MTARECLTCGGQGEVPTAATAHLAGMTVGGFEHPNLQLTACGACGGSGQVDQPPTASGDDVVDAWAADAVTSLRGLYHRDSGRLDNWSTP